ncbi:aminotransferase class V-fold PLP-dependent enzyme [Candidatus Latescibacterota bacterium]
MKSHFKTVGSEISKPNAHTDSDKSCRREFLGKIGVAALTTGLAGCGEEPVVRKPDFPFSSYESLGVKPFLNCRNYATTLSGSLMLPEVKKAMMDASNEYVVMSELMEGVGRRLAELSGAEWGCVNTGAAASLFAATCACVTGDDRKKMALLPDCSTLKNEVLAATNHRHHYDRAITMVGVKIIDVETAEEMEAAVTDKTAVISVLGRALEGGGIPLSKMETAVDDWKGQISLFPDTRVRGGISLEEMVRIGKKYGVPVLVDASAERPDMPDIYIKAGADLVTYSGGKLLRGPQSAGIIIGRKDLVTAADLNMSPHMNFGRPMKVTKEEIMGILVALEMWVYGRDHEAEWKEWGRKLKYISDAVTSIPTVSTSVALTDRRDDVTLFISITWDQDKVKISPREVYRQMSNGEPRIFVHPREKGIEVHAYILEEGIEVPVAQKINEVLSQAV